MNTILEPSHELDWNEIAAAVFQSLGIRTGLWRIGVKLQFAALTGDWQKEGGAADSMPTGITGFAGLVLFPSAEPGPMVFDADPKSRARYPPSKPKASAAKKAARKRDAG